MRRHDESAWADNDPEGAKAGMPMVRRLALVWQKGDWTEHAVTGGVPTWSSRLFPCFSCFAEKREMAVIGDDFEDALPWSPVADEDYRNACDACEVRVLIPDRAAHARIKAALRFDRRKNGSHGRALKFDLRVGGTELKKGDRLEPSEELTDIFGFDAIRDFPVYVLFWRVALQTVALHRNPLLSVPGFGLGRMVPDLLHCLYLGVAQAWIVAAWWRLISADVWRCGSVDLCVMRLRGALFDYYRRHRTAISTKVHWVSRKMLGTSNTPNPQPFKGAEAKHLIPFTLELLAHYRPSGTSELLTAGLALQRMITIIDTNGLNMPPDAARDARHDGGSILTGRVAWGDGGDREGAPDASSSARRLSLAWQPEILQLFHRRIAQ